LSTSILATRTVSTPIWRSSAFWKVTTLRRYGRSPGVSAVVLAFARFSAMTFRRVPCAFMPDAETAIDL